MRAIDTNVIVRFLTRDNPKQADKARNLIKAGAIYVPTTVLLESEWVLRSAYHFPADRIVAAFRAFAGLAGITLEDAPLVSRALDWTEQGMDFADALHLSRAEGCSAFVTFDRKFIKTTASLSDVKVTLP